MLGISVFNVCVVAAVIATLVITNNPLALMGLLVLQAPPVFVPQFTQPEEEESNPIGFVQ